VVLQLCLPQLRLLLLPQCPLPHRLGVLLLL
jgi:hypothetical protein